MPRRVILVRHAAPDADPGVGPADWPLTADGQSAARALRERIPTDATLATSPERKARETLTLATDAPETRFIVDPRFAEVSRPGEPFDDEVIERRLAWISGDADDRHSSWERPDDGARRFQRGIDAIDADTVVVATHGMVMTAWLGSLGQFDINMARGEFWAQLSMSDVIPIDLP